MGVKSFHPRCLPRRFLLDLLNTAILLIVLSGCAKNQSVAETSQSQQASPTYTSVIPSSTQIITSTPTFFNPVPTQTALPEAHHTQVRSTPTAGSDEISPSDMAALVATKKAFEQALLLTPSPTPTARIPITDSGPWLLGRTEKELVLLNRDATGLTRILIEPDTWEFPWNLQGTISSIGNWIAVKTGNHPEYQVSTPDRKPYNLAIQLFQLPSGKLSREISLLSPELSTKIKQDGSWFLNDFIYPLLNSPILWSPDGRYLAFSAALDGPSSDLYVYDSATDRVIRLSDGPNQAWVMSWSPDGKWIIHAESTYMLFDHGSTDGHPITKAVWAAAPDGSALRKVYDADLDIHQIQGWLSPTTFVEQTLRYYGPYTHNIRSVDILSGSSTPLYPCFGSVIGISSTGDVAFLSEGFEDKWADTEALRTACRDPLPRGHYVYQDGKVIALPQEIIAAKWYSELNSFLLPTEAGLEIRDIFGQVMVDFPGDRCFPTLSEDRQWLAFMYPCAKDHEESRRVSIYNLEGELQMKTITEFDNLYWNPDSSGLFLLTGSQLSYFSRLDGETTLLHPDIGVEWLVVVGPSAN